MSYETLLQLYFSLVICSTTLLPNFHIGVGWFITYSVLPKVQKFIVFRLFPIHLDPRTSPSEKISKIFEIYYPRKRVKVLPCKLLSSDFGQSECGSKNP